MNDEVWLKRIASPFLIGGMLLLLIVLTRCGSVIVYSDITGNVIDEATTEPVDGAVVVARWELQGFDPSPLDSFWIMEAVTDASGAYTIPGWGPKINWRFLYTNIRADDPEIIVFKNGYQPLFERNYQSTGSAWFYRTADKLDGRTFALTMFEGSAEAYLGACFDIESRIRWQLYKQSCGWNQIPHLILELHSVGVAATKAGVDGRSLMIGRIPKSDCGDPETYFEGYVL